MSRKHTPLPPPRWARRTVHEDDRVIHERLATLRPPTRLDHAARVVPTEVSVSVADERRAGTWQRHAPSIQVEGGSYTVDGARQLRRALHEVLTAIDEPPTDQE